MRPLGHIVLAAVCLLAPTLLPLSWVASARDRLAEEAQRRPGNELVGSNAVAVAAAANEEYCTPELKRILRRVLDSCGLAGGGQGGRGCQPVQARSVATVSGNDFNALFIPMKSRGGIVQFDKDSARLDGQDTALVEGLFADQRGASYFFVVSRASPEGRTEHNRELSKQRAEAVMTHLREKFQDPDLDREVGLLWLGEEFAQLDEQFCTWSRSGPEPDCGQEALNRSAFVAWIDCTL